MRPELENLAKAFESVEIVDGTHSEENYIPLTLARAQFPTLVNEAIEHGRRVVITKFSRPCAALVPLYDLERLLKIDAEARSKLRVANTATEAGGMIDADDEVAMASAFSEPANADLLRELGQRVVELASDPKVKGIFQNLSQSRPGSKPVSEEPYAPATEEEHQGAVP